MIWPRAKYALKALAALARIEGSAMIGDIARPCRIPHKFLEQILLDLKRPPRAIGRLCAAAAR
jgi:DNA-binding IscR family transcriptional regulator